MTYTVATLGDALLGEPQEGGRVGDCLQREQSQVGGCLAAGRS